MKVEVILIYVVYSYSKAKCEHEGSFYVLHIY